MKRWMTLIELIIVISILAMLMTIWSIKIAENQWNKDIQQEITNVYNIFNSHNRNISRWKSGSQVWILSWDDIKDSIVVRFPDNSTWRVITGENISFGYCSWSTVLWKDIIHSWGCIIWTWNYSILSIRDKKSTGELYAEIIFTQIANTVSIIWTWKFSKYN